eukprot:Clim_evm13s221 gene=Clim_evmTU13s221
MTEEMAPNGLAVSNGSNSGTPNGDDRPKIPKVLSSPAEDREAVSKLLYAVVEGDTDAITRLLQAGTDVMASDYSGNTALHIASLKGRLEVARLLLDNRADPHILNDDGESPLDICLRLRRGEIVGLFKSQGLEIVVSQAPLQLSRQNSSTKKSGLMVEDALSVSSLSLRSVSARSTSKQEPVNLTAQMCRAAYEGDLETLRFYIETAGIGVNFDDYDRRTPLHLAASEGHENVIKYLIIQGADPRAEDRWGGTPLDDARRGGHEAVVKYLEDVMPAPGPVVNDEGSDKLPGTTMRDRALMRQTADPGLDVQAGRIEAYFQAVVRNDVEQMQVMLDDVDVMVRDSDRRTALHWAAAEGNLGAVKFLVSQGADVNAVDRWNSMPLNEAKRSGFADVAEYLAKCGAKEAFEAGDTPHLRETAEGENDVDSNLASQLCAASAAGSVKRLSMLLDLGADVNRGDYDFRTALHLAASEGHLDAVKLLVERGAHIDAEDRWKGTPIADAIRSGHQSVVDYLLSVGAQLPPRESFGQITDSMDASALLLIAATKNDTIRMRELLRAGVDPSAPDYDRRTALHLAAAEGNMDCCKILVEAGADINAKDRWGGTPLRDAQSGQHNAVKEYLMGHGAEEDVQEAPFVSHPPSADGLTLSDPTLSNDGEGSTHTINAEAENDNLYERGVSEGWEVDPMQLSIREMIDYGGAGEIFKGKWRGLDVAIKKLRANENAKLNATFVHILRNEIALMSTLRHPNLVMFLGACSAKNPPLLIEEYMPGGTLDQYLEKLSVDAKLCPRRQAFRFMKDILLGMNFLHQCNPQVIHRDLKPANLLFDKAQTIKIADFGLGFIMEKDTGKARRGCLSGYKDMHRAQRVGSLIYMSPECFRKEVVDEKTDVYSFALIVWYIFAGIEPFCGVHGPEIVEIARKAAYQGYRPPISRVKDKAIAALIEACWDNDRTKRPSFEAILDRMEKELEANGKEGKEGKEKDGKCVIQ